MPFRKFFNLAEIKEVIFRMDAAAILGWYDIKLSYRRTKLGLVWMSLTLIIESLILCCLFSHLFNEDFYSFYKYIFVGNIIWRLISTIINESMNALIASRTYILNTDIPIIVLIARIIFKSLIIFFHNMVFALLLISFGGLSSISIYWLTIPFAAVFIAVTIMPYAFILAVLGARFRDLIFLRPYMLQILFYITPIVWKTEYLSGKYAFVFKLNPFIGLLEFLRSIFLSQTFDASVLIPTFICGLVGWALAIVTYNLSKDRVCYWIL